MHQIILRASVLMAAIAVLPACSNGGSGGTDGTDGSDRGSNSLPNLQLNDGDVLGGGSSIVRILAGDDTGIVRVGNTIVRQGPLAECNGRFADDSLVAGSLVEACTLDQPACAVTFQPVDGQIEVIPPPLFAPIGLEYDVTLVDRDGSTTDPVRAVFCFDVGLNAPPVTTPDTFQLSYPSQIQRSGVRYGDRCEKADGSQGVLANDEDDEHITNTCLRAELVELPTYASNLSTFSATFGSDGSFVYEAFGDIPPEDSAGVSIDSFTYRVTDGVNPASAPVRVDIVFADSENSAPQASDDNFSVPEDSGLQTFAVLNNDLDPDALPLSVISISNGPGNGVANIRNGTLIEYRPRTGFVGRDTFTYTAQDSGGLTVTANVVIDVTNVNDAPQALNDTVTTNENISVAVRVLSNDSDIEGDTLSVVSAANPLHGSTSVSAEGTVNYTPDPGYSGPDSFEYTISDGNATATATVVVTVVNVNVGPVAGSDEISLAEGASAVFNLLDNDTDGDSDALNIVNVGAASNGTTELLADGTVRYTPNDGFSGTDNFTYTISDGAVEATGQVSVVVSLVNGAPTASNDAASTAENTAVVIDVLNNDTDPDGDSLSLVSVSNLSSGSAVINSDNTVTYTPADSFSGQGGFSYTIEDGNGETASASVSVTVSSSNESPVAVDDVRTTEQDDPVGIRVLQNDSDADGDSLTISVLSQPSNGTASVTNQGDVIVYSPAAGFSGTDSFTYQVSDGNGGVAVATVNVTVTGPPVAINTPPTASADVAQVLQGESVSIDVRANDSDPDGDVLTVSIATPPSNGSAVVTANNVVYTPAAAFSGEDTIVYSIADGQGGTATASVVVTVAAVIVNAPPTASADVAQVLQGELVTIDVLDNDSDPDGDALTVSIVTAPSSGSAVVSANNVEYTAAPAFTGEDTIVYSIADGEGGTDTASVVVTVVAPAVVNNAPTAGDDIAQATQGVAVNFNILANDTDPDGDSLTVTVTSPPAEGIAIVLPDNRIRYTPSATYSGADSIGYTVDDGNGGTDTAVVSITVASVNAPPVASADAVVTNQGEAVNVSVLSNDSDADGDTLSVSIDTGPTNGFAVIAADSSINYEPAPGFSGSDSLVYLISDGSATDTATVEITVTPVVINTPPVAVNDTAVTDQDLPVAISVLANDTDADGDTLSIESIIQPQSGTVTDASGVITYTPVAGFFGVDEFDYSVSDPDGAVSSGTVTVTVTQVVTNSLPLAVDDIQTTEQNTPVTVVVLANDSDVDGDPLEVTAASGASNGTVAINADGTVDYAPAVDFVGDDSFAYTIDDGVSGTASASVAISVTAAPVVVTPTANTAPIALDDSVAATVGSVTRIRVLDNDSDADNDRLTPALDAPLSPALGSVEVHNNNRWLVYTAGDTAGIDSFGYTIDDGNGGTDSAIVTVAIADL